MRRGISLGLGSVLLLWSLALGAWDIGQHCLGFDAHSDVVRLWVLVSDEAPLMANVALRWRSEAPEAAYQLLGTGTLANALPGGTHPYEIGVQLTHATPAFNSARVCAFRIKLDAAFNAGPWELECLSPTTSFTLAGTLTYEACPADGVSLAADRSHLPTVGYSVSE